MSKRKHRSAPVIKKRTKTKASTPKPCPTPSKPSYSTRKYAEAAMAGSKRHRDPREDQIYTYPRQRAYPCRCGKWHLTSKE